MYSCFLFFSNSIILHKQRVVQVVLGRFTSRLFFRRAGFRHVSVQLFPGVPDFGTFPCSYFPACRISARFRAAISRRAGFRHVSVQLFPGVPDFGTFPCSYFPACRISARFRAAISRRAGFRHISVQLFPGVPDFGTFPCSYFPACRISARSCAASPTVPSFYITVAAIPASVRAVAFMDENP